jgi:hypothetical protein
MRSHAHVPDMPAAMNGQREAANDVGEILQRRGGDGARRHFES